MDNNEKDLSNLEKLMEEKLKGILAIINLNHKSTQDKLENINVKVDKIEDRQDEMNKTIQNIMLNDSNKCNSCLNTKTIAAMNEKIDRNKKDHDDLYGDLRFWVKNPKVFMGAISVCVVFALLGYAKIISEFTAIDTKIKSERYYYRDPNEPQVLRGGSVDTSGKAREDTNKTTYK